MTHPFIDFVNEDKSKYPLAKIKGFLDLDDDWLIGNSGGFLMKWDFIFVNTDKFRQVAVDHDKNQKNLNIITWVKALDLPKGIPRGRFYYCPYEIGSEEYNAFWKRETQHRKKGMTKNCKLYTKDIQKYINAKTPEDAKRYLHPLHITGDFYHYLNYGRIKRTPTDDEKESMRKAGDKRKKIDGFPRFWDGDYWNFKAQEFAYNNGFNLCKGKARRKGYSFKRGAQGASTINLNPGVTILLAAYEERYLTNQGATADMVNVNIRWLEEHTYWRRGTLTDTNNPIHLGYKSKEKGNRPYGYLSQCMSVTTKNNPSACIGKDALEIDFEEAGYFPNLLATLDVTMSTIEAGAEKTGVLNIYGTAGAKDADWEAFAKVHKNPYSYNMMPFEDVWDRESRHLVCGFFHPQILNLEPFVDEDGNSQLMKSLEYDTKDKEEARHSKSLTNYLAYVAQRANSPDDAFSIGIENLFSSAELNLHVLRVMGDPDLKFYRDGQYVEDKDSVTFITNKELEDKHLKVHPYIESVPVDPNLDITGCFREFYSPFRVNGTIPDDLYYVTCDTVAKDKDQKEFIVRNSLNAIQVWMYPNNLHPSGGDILVASYAGRTSQMSDTNRMIRLTCKRWNARCLAEVDTGTVVADFRTWGCLDLLHKDPSSVLDEKLNKNDSPNYGIIIGGTDKKQDGLLYLKDFLYTPVSKNSDSGETIYRLHYIYDLPFLKELQKFVKDKNYDRISTAIVAMFQRAAYRIKRKEPTRISGQTTISEIGLFNYKPYNR